MRAVLLLMAVLAGAPMEAPRSAAADPADVPAVPGLIRAAREAPKHDLHITSGNAAVEGSLVLTRIRFFRDDLEEALRGAGAGPDFVLGDNPDVDAAFMAYLADRYVVWVGDQRLTPTLIGKGEDELDREPVWWYAIQHEAPGEVGTFRVRNTLLLELFDDQRNIVKFVHFPDETQRTYSFGEGDEEFEVRF
jgi:hypothetical protein